MGWANCGEDSKGRPIGYAHEATCDHPGCTAKIDRGLSYACGGMHGDCGGQACEGYFCQEHLHLVDRKAMGFTELDQGQLCPACLESARKEIADMVVNGDLCAVDPEDVAALATAQARIERLEAALREILDTVPEELGCGPRCPAEITSEDQAAVTRAFEAARAALKDDPA